jgi:acetyl-CoA acyltransferase
LKGLLKNQSTLDPKSVSDVIIGCAMPEAEQGMNVARTSLLMAGFPQSVSGLTLNRMCASGLQAISCAADKIRLAEAELIIAGGVESMSFIPMFGHRMSWNPSIFHDGNLALAYNMGVTAEFVAHNWKISREAQDEFSFLSHKKAIEAIQNKEFQEEILPYHVSRDLPGDDDLKVESYDIEEDEGPRKDTNLNALSKLKTVFVKDGTVTAGNSSQMSDGASVVLVASEKAIKDFNLTPLAKFIGYSVCGVAPETMGMGPKDAIPKVCEMTGIKKEDLDWIELNEAFAAQSLAVIKDLDLDVTKVNPLGGAIALGHPLGATGAIRSTTLVHGLKRKKLKYGMVTMCVGSGMGAAGVFESL